MSKIVVPDGMLKAFKDSMDAQCAFVVGHDAIELALEAALLWLSENPIVPDDKIAHELWKVALELDPDRNENGHAAKNLVIEWQRRMFLSSEPEIPEEIKDLLVEGIAPTLNQNHSIIEAYRRGKASR